MLISQLHPSMLQLLLQLLVRYQAIFVFLDSAMFMNGSIELREEDSAGAGDEGGVLCGGAGFLRQRSAGSAGGAAAASSPAPHLPHSPEPRAPPHPLPPPPARMCDIASAACPMSVPRRPDDVSWSATEHAGSLGHAASITASMGRPQRVIIEGIHDYLLKL